MDTDREIVITGVSGQLPECENVDEFMRSLMDGVYLVTENDRRYKSGYRRTPKRLGTIPSLDKFDNTFFGIPHMQAAVMDPRHRIVLESVYECIIDSGTNPNELRGTKTGVYLGIASTDAYCGQMNIDRGMNIVGALAANRISYAFDFKGPSYVCDTACSTSFYALVNAFKDLYSGEIDNAIVAAVNVIVDPYETAEFVKSGILSKEGYCKTFCVGRDGYVRSESVISLLLQKRRNARRIYATIVGAKLNADGYKKEGPNYPSSEAQIELMENTSEKFNIDIDDVEYFEAHGTGTVVGDECECRALTKFYSRKTEPLLIGSVKSNMGHAEMSAGLCSILKCLTIIHKETIPATLLHGQLDTSLPGISNGKLKVVDKNYRYKDGLIGLNSFGFGGANGHIVLKPFTKSWRSYPKRDKRLVFASGRTAESVNRILDTVIKHNSNPEFLALIDEIHKTNIDGHIYRGSVITGDKESRTIEKFKSGRPIWFIYSGVGSQWLTMGKDLLKMEVFKNTFDRCAIALNKYNYDLYQVVTSEDPSIFDDIMNCFVGISAIQIALTDVLRFLGIEPDGYIGHSLGECACAYVEDSLTPEEAVLFSYAKGYGYRKAMGTMVPGTMVAVGLSKDEIEPLLPNGIYVACQNSSTSVTIAGRVEETNQFTKYLISKGIFAKQVNSCNLPLHTKYTDLACRYGYEFLKTVFKGRNKRSTKWISSSVPETGEVPVWSKYNCAEYHYNNTLNTVLFDQALKHIPENAIIIEVSPHGTLQPILKREFGPEVTNIALCDRNSTDNELFFLNAIGRFYRSGGQPQVRKLYPEVTFPVSRGTPLLSPVVSWDHSTTWPVPNTNSSISFSGKVTINLSKPEDSTLNGHIVHDMTCMAGAAYILMVWKIFSEEFHLKNWKEFPVVLERIEFYRLTTLPPDENVNFYVNIVKKSGNFEIYESGSLVCSGNIKSKQDVSSEFEILETPIRVSPTNFVLKRNEIYKFFNLKGQIFCDLYKSILECSIDGSEGKIEWRNDIVTFIENMLQLSGFAIPNFTGFMFTSTVHKIVIDPKQFFEEASQNTEILVSSRHFKNAGRARCKGIAVFGHELVNVFTKPRIILEPCLETQEFIYFHDNQDRVYTISSALSVALQIISQNSPVNTEKLKICEVVSSAKESGSLYEEAILNLEKHMYLEADYRKIDMAETQENFDILILTKFVLSEMNVINITDFLKEGGFLIYHGFYEDIKKFKLDVIFDCITDEENIYVLRSNKIKEYRYLEVQSDGPNWFNDLKKKLRSHKNETFILYDKNEQNYEIVGMTECLLHETDNIRYVRIDDKEASFNIGEDLYKNQLRKDLRVNIMKNGRWGTYVYCNLIYGNKKAVSNASLTMKTVGDLSSLAWEESPVKRWANDDLQLVDVHYSGLNMLDCFWATGKFHPTYFRADSLYFGYEYSGFYKGKRVMGITKSAGISLKVTPIEHLMWDIPEQWSLEDAATVPFAYAMSYYALFTRGGIRKQDCILLLMSTDTVGLAAMSLILNTGCKLFVMLANEKQRSILMEMFPSLEENFIGTSQNSNFDEVIMSHTNSRGIDLLLNCSTDDMANVNITPLFKCLVNNGRCFELYPNNVFIDRGVKHLTSDYNYERIQPDLLILSSKKIQTEIAALIRRGIESDVVKPLPRTLFPHEDVESAFRCLESGQNEGKVLIELRKKEVQIESSFEKILAYPKVFFDPNKSFLLIGKSGNINLEITDWLIRKGATKIVINSQKPDTTGYQALCLRKWSMFENVKVEVYSEDADSFQGSSDLLFKAKKLGSLGGIFICTNSQGKDNIEEQSIDFTLVKSKLLSVTNMDTLTRKYCPEMDHFVIFSSISPSWGIKGQATLRIVSSAVENLCRKRREDGLEALAIRWGPINETGCYENSYKNNTVKDYVIPQSIASCLDTLEKFMLQTQPVCISYLVSERSSKRVKKVMTLIESVALILGIKNIDTVDESITLTKLGMDSLMAAEVRQTLHRNFHIDLETENLRDLTLSDLSKMK